MHFKSIADEENEDQYNVMGQHLSKKHRPAKSSKTRTQKPPTPSMGQRSLTLKTLQTATDLQNQPEGKKVVKTSMFEQFVKKSIKQDLFNLTYEDEVFASYLRDFVPRSDFFIKPEMKANSPAIAIGDDGSVYTAWKKPENRKKRKSQKLEFLTTLLDAMMASISEYAAKIKVDHEQEIQKVRDTV